jgi:hypothetical protein
MINRYSLTHPLIDGSIELEYTSGLLTEYTLKGSIPFAALKTMLGRFPVSENMLKETATHPDAKITQIASDLSFERFWNAYDNKSAGSSKKDAERRWNKLSDTDRQLALKHIAVYNRELAKTGTAKKYAETYINQRPWDR